MPAAAAESDAYDRQGQAMVRALLRRGRQPGGTRHGWGSRQLHRLNELSASTSATAAAAILTAGSLLVALLASSASKVLTAFEAISSGVTLVMIFVVQHTQSRQQAAVQRKLDELLRALPGADQRLLHLESAPQDELDALDERHEHVRVQALDGHATATPG